MEVKPDWEAIKAAYCAGAETLRAIAEQHGITEGALRKRAGRDQWVRKPVRKAVRTYAGTQTGTQALTETQIAFVEELVVDGNVRKAAERAGYAEPACSVAKMRNNDAVQAAALERIEAVAERCGLSAELVVRSIVRELQFDPAKVFNDDGSLKPISEIDPDTRMALQAIETSQSGGESPVTVRKVKWASASSARDQAMKHLGMYLLDRKQQTDPLSELIKAIQGRGSIGPAMRSIEQEDVDD